MWFTETDITKHQYSYIFLENLHGYVLPHAGTKYTGHILSHTLRFRPTKKFNNIIIFYLPSSEKPNVNGYYHEYFVPSEALKLYYPSDKYNYIPYNVNANVDDKSKLNISNLTKDNTLFVISADFSHFLDLQSAIKLENCAAHSLMHNNYNTECIKVVDNVKNFTTMYSIFSKQLLTTHLQWIGRTRSPGVKGVGYLSFLLRDKPNLNTKKPDGFFITAFDKKMRQRECLGNTNKWSYKIQTELIKDVLYKAKTTSRLTSGMYLHTPITNYTITYLYKDNTQKFIRGYHAILKGSLYLPDVFLENTYDNGKWLQSTDIYWNSNPNFNLEHTFIMLQQKAGWESKDYQLFSSEVLHKNIKYKTNTKKTKKIKIKN